MTDKNVSFAGLHCALYSVKLNHDLPDGLSRLFEAATARIESFAPTMVYENGVNFGIRLLGHQERVAEDVYKFMRLQGFSSQEACAVQHAALLHDIGKTHEAYKGDPHIWNRADKQQAKADEPEKQLHAYRGLQILNELAQETAFETTHPQFRLMLLTTLAHHERIDGSGYPAGVSNIPEWLQIVGLADTFDGDGIQRTGQDPRTREEILFRMSGDDPNTPKYKGAFDPDLFKAYEAYKLG